MYMKMGVKNFLCLVLWQNDGEIMLVLHKNASVFLSNCAKCHF